MVYPCLSAKKEQEDQRKDHSQRCKPPAAASEAVVSFLDEHAGARDCEHSDPKHVRIVDPPITGILVKLGHLSQERRGAVGRNFSLPGYHIYFNIAANV